MPLPKDWYPTNEKRPVQVNPELHTGEGEDPTGITAPDPLPDWLGSVVYPLGQAWGYDIPEAAGQIVQHSTPGDVGGAVAKNVPGAAWTAQQADVFRQRAEATPFRRALRTAGDIVNLPAMAATGGAGEVASLGALVERNAPQLMAAWNRLTPAVKSLVQGLFGAESQPNEPNDPNFWRTERNKAILGTTLTGVGAKAADVQDRRAATRQAGVAATASQNVANRDEYARQSTAAAQAMQNHLRNTLHVEERNRLALADWDKAKAERQGLDVRENIAWMRRSLEPLGLEHETPTEAGDAGLNKVRDLIGGKLNEANAQLTFNPIEADAINRMRDVGKNALNNIQSADQKRYWAGVMRNAVLTPIAELDKTGGRWIEKDPLVGQDFATYVSKLNATADNLARAAKFPSANSADQLHMANALHVIADLVEDGAEGPATAKALRDNARNSYRIYSHLGRTADPGRQSIATSGQMADELERRAGTADRYRAKLAAGDPDVTHANRWLTEASRPAPDKPTLEKAPRLPQEAIDPRQPPTLLPPQPPGPGPRTPVQEFGRRAALLPGWIVGSELYPAHPIVGGGVGAAAMEALLHMRGDRLQQALAASANRAPYATGAAAGQFAQDPTAPLSAAAGALPAAVSALGF